jgi:hypothetical protein
MYERIILTHMTTGSVELRPRTTGEIFALTFDLYRRHFPLFFSIIAVVLLPIMLLNALSAIAALGVIVMTPGEVPEAVFAGLVFAFNCIPPLLWLLGIFWPWAEGALSFNVIERVLGREPGLRASYSQTRQNWASLWIANLLAQIGISLPLLVAYLIVFAGLFSVALVPLMGVFGADVYANVPPIVPVVMAVLCVPLFIGALVVSVVLAINWTFRAPAIVGEGVDGLRGLSRSVAIARGDRWRIFWRYVLLFIVEFLVVAVPSLIVSGVLLAGAFALQRNSLPSTLDFDVAALPGFVAIAVVAAAFSVIGSLLIAPFRVVFTALNYLDLRIRKENLAALLASAAVSSASNATSPPAGVEQPASPVAQPAPSAPGSPYRSADWKAVDLAKLTPGQRVGVLFNRIRAEGENAQMLNDLALALMEIGDWGGALDALTRARAIAPTDPDVVYNLMVLYRERRDTTAARRMMQEYLRLETNPDELAAVRNDPRFKDLLPE